MEHSLICTKSILSCFSTGGNYNGYNLASSIQDLLNANEINFTSEVVYNNATGTTKIEEISEGIHASNLFEVPSGFGILYWDVETNGVHPWRNTDETYCISSC